jgi:hypothetical protein
MNREQPVHFSGIDGTATLCGNGLRLRERARWDACEREADEERAAGFEGIAPRHAAA